MSNKPVVLCFHGSPGTVSDFNELKILLPEVQWEVVARTGLQPPPFHKNAPRYCLGYSWGSHLCLREAAHNPQCQGIILVAPFAGPRNLQKKPLLFSILNSTGLAHFVLGLVGKQAVKGFLEKTARPSAIPASYQDLADKLSAPQALFQGLAERHFFQDDLEILCREITQNNIPVLVVSGDSDAVDPAGESSAFFRKNLPKATFVGIPQGPHALLWTHTKVLASNIQSFLKSSAQFDKAKSEKHESENRAGEVEGKVGYFPGKHVLNNCTSLFQEHLQKTPHKTVLRWVSPDHLKVWQEHPEQALLHKDYTFEEMFGMAARVATGLRNLGLEKGDRVLLFVPMTPFLYVTMFALQMLGAIPVFLDTWARRQQLGIVSQIVTPKAILTLEKAFELCKGVEEVEAIPLKICLGPATQNYTARVEKLIAKSEPLKSPVAVEREDTALITFTTGSSGVPKGANRTHRFLAAQHYALQKCIPYEDSDLDMPVFPVFSLNNMASGVTTVLPAIDVANPSEHDGKMLLKQLLESNVTCATLNPSLLGALAKAAKAQGVQLTKLRRVFAGGAAVSRDALIEFLEVAPKADILVAYGSTEAEPIAHIFSSEALALKSRSQDDPELVDDGVNVGHFAEGLEFKFIQISGEPVEIHSADDWKKIEVPENEVGEIIVAGEHVCREYYNDPGAFKRAKILDNRGVVWHRTGDVGKVDDKGHLWLVGRVHNVIVRKGKAHFPVNAEIVLKRLPFAKQVAYLGVPDAEFGKKAYAVIAPHNAAFLQDDAAQKEATQEIERLLLKNGLPVDMVLFRPEIPMDPRHRSKVEYDALRKSLFEKNEGHNA